MGGIQSHPPALTHIQTQFIMGSKFLMKNHKLFPLGFLSCENIIAVNEQPEVLKLVGDYGFMERIVITATKAPSLPTSLRH